MLLLKYRCNKCDVVFSIFQKMIAELISNRKVCDLLLKSIISDGSGTIFQRRWFLHHRLLKIKK